MRHVAGPLPPVSASHRTRTAQLVAHLARKPHRRSARYLEPVDGLQRIGQTNRTMRLCGTVSLSITGPRLEIDYSLTFAVRLAAGPRSIRLAHATHRLFPVRQRVARVTRVQDSIVVEEGAGDLSRGVLRLTGVPAVDGYREREKQNDLSDSPLNRQNRPS